METDTKQHVRLQQFSLDPTGALTVRFQVHPDWIPLLKLDENKMQKRMLASLQDDLSKLIGLVEESEEEEEMTAEQLYRAAELCDLEDEYEKAGVTGVTVEELHRRETREMLDLVDVVRLDLMNRHGTETLHGPETLEESKLIEGIRIIGEEIYRSEMLEESKPSEQVRAVLEELYREGPSRLHRNRLPPAWKMDPFPGRYISVRTVVLYRDMLSIVGALMPPPSANVPVVRDRLLALDEADWDAMVSGLSVSLSMYLSRFLAKTQQGR